MGRSDKPKRPSNKASSRRPNTEEHLWEAPAASDTPQVYYDPGGNDYVPEAPSIPRGIDLAQDLVNLDINGTNGAIDVSETPDDFYGGVSGATPPQYTHQGKGKEKYVGVEGDDFYDDGGFNTSYPGAGADLDPSIPLDQYYSTGTHEYTHPDEEDDYGNDMAGEPSFAMDDNGASEHAEMPNPSNLLAPTDSETYQVAPGTTFQPGEIFKTIWSTPRGVNLAPHSPEPTELRAGDDPRFFVGPRRFIVVARDEGNHSTCVPIFTYNRKGCKKKGLKPKAHGIVYSKPGKPRKLSDEPELGFKPVAVNMYGELEKLDKASRVNYSKLTEIDHNVPVIFIGHIDPKDWDIVLDAVNERWESKQKQPSSRSKHHSSRKRH
ncbi:putative DUF6590 domain-containing protein [Seiridium cardinale]|uniref:DUF6590 domain-containing protein n=1 Tax=Seiridium cardinale TaxID=138064 RepID=A0ABR2XKW3_9PEZI